MDATRRRISGRACVLIFVTAALPLAGCAAPILSLSDGPSFEPERSHAGDRLDVVFDYRSDTPRAVVDLTLGEETDRSGRSTRALLATTTNVLEDDDERRLTYAFPLDRRSLETVNRSRPDERPGQGPWVRVLHERDPSWFAVAPYALGFLAEGTTFERGVEREIFAWEVPVRYTLTRARGGALEFDVEIPYAEIAPDGSRREAEWRFALTLDRNDGSRLVGITEDGHEAPVASWKLTARGNVPVPWRSATHEVPPVAAPGACGRDPTSEDAPRAPALRLKDAMALARESSAIEPGSRLVEAEYSQGLPTDSRRWVLTFGTPGTRRLHDVTVESAGVAIVELPPRVTEEATREADFAVPPEAWFPPTCVSDARAWDAFSRLLGEEAQSLSFRSWPSESPEAQPPAAKGGHSRSFGSARWQIDVSRALADATIEQHRLRIHAETGVLASEAIIHGRLAQA